ncbi:hypothetical protein D018_0491A, partial [Vibrio parahaemolyticus VP2007-007]
MAVSLKWKYTKTAPTFCEFPPYSLSRNIEKPAPLPHH